jgi:hypothetical protein
MDDWNTVNIKPGKGGVIRDIDLLRKRYDDHRATLEQLAADAPTEHLARRYRELIADVDSAVAKLDALDAEPADPRPAREPAAARSWADAPVYAHEPISSTPRRRPGGGRALLILLAGTFMIGILALLFWGWLRADDPGEPIVRPETTMTDTAPVPVPEVEPELLVVPERHDYGTIRRGARAARQFEIQNQTDATLAIDVKRSACRCLWFEYADTIPARGTTTLTVTVDASKVTGSRLEETVEVATAGDPAASATFVVAARIGDGGAQ